MSIVSQLRGVDGLVVWTEASDGLPNENALCAIQLVTGDLRFARFAWHAPWMLLGGAGISPSLVERWLEVTADVEASMLEILKPIGVASAVSSNAQTVKIKTSDGLREMDFRRRCHDVSERDE